MGGEWTIWPGRSERARDRLIEAGVIADFITLSGMSCPELVFPTSALSAVREIFGVDTDRALEFAGYPGDPRYQVVQNAPRGLSTALDEALLDLRTRQEAEAEEPEEDDEFIDDDVDENDDPEGESEVEASSDGERTRGYFDAATSGSRRGCREVEESAEPAQAAEPDSGPTVYVDRTGVRRMTMPDGRRMVWDPTAAVWVTEQPAPSAPQPTETPQNEECSAYKGGEELVDGQWRVRVESKEHMQQYDNIRRAMTEYSRFIRRNISCFNCHQRPHGRLREVANDSLRILFWASPEWSEGPSGDSFPMPPEELKKNYTGTMVWGNKLGIGQGDGFRCPPGAERVIFSSEGDPVAVIQGNYIFVLFDLPHVDTGARVGYGAANAYYILTAILDSWANGRYTVYDVDTAGIQLDRFMESLRSSVRGRIAELDSSISTYRRRVRDYERCADESRQMLMSFITQRRALDSGIALERDFIEDQLAAIQGIEEVDSINFSDHRLLVRTKLLNFTVTPGGLEYVGGEYVIKIRPGGGIVEISNSMRPSATAHPHPHVNTDGRPCYGNIRSLVTRMLTEFRYAELVELLITYLQEVNAADWYQDPDGMWPRVDSDDGRAIIEGAAVSQQQVEQEQEVTASV